MPTRAAFRARRIAARLAEVGYVADRDLATALWMMDYLKRPLLIEGEAGVGKTEVAKALAARARRRAHPHAMLRGARRQFGAL